MGASNVPAHYINFGLKHELNHAVLSGAYHSRWFEEALTEHIARVFDGADPDTFNPSGHPDNGVYIEEREVVDTLANYGREKVPPALFTRFYTARSPEARAQMYFELDNALERAWGAKNVLGLVTQAIKSQELADIDAGKTEREAEIKALNTVRSDLLQRPEYVFAGLRAFDLTGQPA